ncbi:TIGR00255 family protein [Nonlabens sp. Hel1_33_55]|uniref:YicC family protein n=1 Tax=Nonlabens sp. Hel1_33_55 TaxID=1336802 RepID=UPI000875AD36|nr:DUF1732 domain-containing protein [Nonlabens sp. Hel1_33_55]SCY29568.1 TIGR00255 family protein [Nonlabens sp. Hel1_33_55]
MIISMTGYGKSVQQLPQRKITVEIRTLNSKNLDLNLRIPSAYREKELDIRKIAAAQLSRGKIDLALHVENTSGKTGQKLNIDQIEQYIDQLSQIQNLDASDKLKLVEIATSFPDVFQNIEEEIEDSEFQIVLKTVNEALDAVNDYRETEGSILQEEFTNRINNIAQLLDDVIVDDKNRLDGIRTRLEKAVADLKEKVDENRFEQELIYYLEKYDITEEKVRLNNHLNYFKQTMSASTSQGKKLAFISQEIGREINTIGSKANHAAMQQKVVQMKDELEKIKEQMLNVL